MKEETFHVGVKYFNLLFKILTELRIQIDGLNSKVKPTKFFVTTSNGS